MTRRSTEIRSDAHPLRDSLTKALSRPQFGYSIEDEKERADLSGVPFVLCLIDIDRLRNINDELGMRVGDAVIAEVAERLRRRLDESDFDDVEYLHARFDGDALILLARDSSIKQGTRLAEALRAAISDDAFADNLRVTVSIGVTQYRIGETTDAVLGRIEKTLFLAQQFGTGRIEIAATPENYRDSKVIPLPKRPHQRRRPRIVVA